MTHHMITEQTPSGNEGIISGVLMPIYTSPTIRYSTQLGNFHFMPLYAFYSVAYISSYIGLTTYYAKCPISEYHIIYCWNINSEYVSL